MKSISSRYTQVIQVLVSKNVDLVFTVVLLPALPAFTYFFTGLKLYSLKAFDALILTMHLEIHCGLMILGIAWQYF